MTLYDVEFIFLLNNLYIKHHTNYHGYKYLNMYDYDIISKIIEYIRDNPTFICYILDNNLAEDIEDYIYKTEYHEDSLFVKCTDSIFEFFTYMYGLNILEG